MGFGSFVGGIMLCILAAVIGFIGFATLLGFFNAYVKSFAVFLGIGTIIAALFMFAYGWYLYKSAKPQGTINVHNV